MVSRNWKSSRAVCSSALKGVYLICAAKACWLKGYKGRSSKILQSPTAALCSQRTKAGGVRSKKAGRQCSEEWDRKCQRVWFLTRGFWQCTKHEDDSCEGGQKARNIKRSLALPFTTPGQRFVVHSAVSSHVLLWSDIKPWSYLSVLCYSFPPAKLLYLLEGKYGLSWEAREGALFSSILSKCLKG